MTELVDDIVLVMVPNESSVVTTASGESFLVEIDESGRRIVRLPSSSGSGLIEQRAALLRPIQESEDGSGRSPWFSAETDARHPYRRCVDHV